MTFGIHSVYFFFRFLAACPRVAILYSSWDDGIIEASSVGMKTGAIPGNNERLLKASALKKARAHAHERRTTPALALARW